MIGDCGFFMTTKQLSSKIKRLGVISKLMKRNLGGKFIEQDH